MTMPIGAGNEDEAASLTAPPPQPVLSFATVLPFDRYSFQSKCDVAHGLAPPWLGSAFGIFVSFGEARTPDLCPGIWQDSQARRRDHQPHPQPADVIPERLNEFSIQHVHRPA